MLDDGSIHQGCCRQAVVAGTAGAGERTRAIERPPRRLDQVQATSMALFNRNKATEGQSPKATPVYRVAPMDTREGILRPLREQAGTELIILPRTQPFRIGRDSACDLQLFDVRVSRNHAQIEFSAGEYVLTDLNSSNGVYVNGARLTRPVVLQDNDVLEIGSFGGIILRFEFVELG
jgi:hypothetical protein